MSSTSSKRRLAQLDGALRSTTQDAVAVSLRRAIVSGELPGGTPLVLSELAEQLGVSTTPVREAIRRLATEGLVDIVSYRSSVVHLASADEIVEVYQLRMLLEPLAIARSVVQISPAELDAADELRRQMEATTDVGEWVVMNHDFHGILVDGAHSPILASLLATLRDAASLIVGLSIRTQPAQLTDGNADHAELIDAFRRGDVDRAVEVTREHLQSTLSTMRDAPVADRG